MNERPPGVRATFEEARVRRRAVVLSTGSLGLAVTFEPELDDDALAALEAELAAPSVLGVISAVRAELGPKSAILDLGVAEGTFRLDRALELGPLAPGLAAALAATASSLVAGLHAAGRVHGRLGPRALWLSPTGSVALVGPGLPGLTVLLAPPGIAAPDLEPGPASDVYALGALYCELLTGQPFSGIPSLRPALTGLLGRVCSPRPEDRPDAEVFAHAIVQEAAAAQIPLATAADVVALAQRFGAPPSALYGADPTWGVPTAPLLARPEATLEVPKESFQGKLVLPAASSVPTQVPQPPPPPLRSSELSQLINAKPRPKPPPPKPAEVPWGTLMIAALGVITVVGGFFALTPKPPPPPPEIEATSVDLAPDAGFVAPIRAPDASVEVKRVDMVTVISQPSGASVEIDGGYVGDTPLVLKHALERRMYTISVSKPGYVSWVRPISPDPLQGGISVTAILQKETPR